MQRGEIIMEHSVDLVIDCAAKHKPSLETPQVLCIKTLVKVPEALFLSAVFPCFAIEKVVPFRFCRGLVPTCRNVRILPANACCVSHEGGFEQQKRRKAI